MEQAPIHLTILRRGDTHIVDLAEVGSLIPRSETQVDSAFLDDLTAEIMRLAAPGYGTRAVSETPGSVSLPKPTTVREDLQRVGELIFSHLLTEPARKRLRSADPCDLYLRLDERLVQIPWELCHDGKDFLATKFRVGRQVITGAQIPETAKERKRKEVLKVLLIVDPTESLPEANREAEQLCSLLDTLPQVEVTLLGGKQVRKIPLLGALQDHDVVHFAGHSYYDPENPSKSGWRLQEGVLTAGELSKLRHSPVLVFSNSCQAGATAEWTNGYRYEGQAFGMGSAFLLAGVRNYLGTFWVVHDEESVLFATTFYQNLVAGRSLGEAVLSARHEVLQQKGWNGLTWASFMLYGDPAFTLLPTTQARPLSSVSAAPQHAQGMQRKLAAILSADVKGYSRLMGEDEVATIRTLTAYREMMTALIQQHHGRVVDAPGDNLLAEFASAVDAVQGAVEIQEALKTRNAELLPHRRMEFRIGLNVGDVISEGERLYGDGVNIAARLEALAEGGGICISGTVYDQVETKLALRYEDLGEQTVKNIAKPVRVYRVLPSLATTPPVVSHQLSVDSHQKTEGSSVQLVTAHWQLATPLVGRETELAQLQQWLAKALQGERQVVFVTGEPGIGKTTVVEAFLSGIGQRGTGNGQQGSRDPIQLIPDARSPAPSLWLGQGQCIEHYGAGEAYLPVLTALGQLCRESEGQRLVDILNQYAPTWLMQMPALLSAADLDTLQRKTQGATRERMLREIAEAVEALTAEKPLVLWLEDLHWSDYSTLDLIAFLARRRQPARLLVIGTARPVEGTEHPLRTVKQELQLHGQCHEMALGFLTETQVTKYLEARFSIGARRTVPLQHLTHLIHQRTEGNPLFMVNVVNELLTREKLDDAAVEINTPTSIRQMVEQHLERLSTEEQRVLEVASVAGVEFSAAAVAAGAEGAVDEIEERCTGLARRKNFLQAKGTTDWPDGTVAARYGFIHALYQEVVYERVTAGRRVRLHQRIGERLEAAYDKHAREIAAELAVHFEQGREYQRAVQYLEHAGKNALRRTAHQEAIGHLTKALELLKTLPDTSERTQQELRLQIALGTPLIATKGYAAPKVEKAYARALELCRQIGETPQLFPVLGGLCVYYQERAEFQTARQLAQQMLALAQRTQDPVFLLWGHLALGSVLYSLGELVPARVHLEQSLTLYDLQKHRTYGFVQDPGVTCLLNLSVLLWCMGYPDQALQRSQEALTLAKQLAHPYSLAFAHQGAAEIHRLCGQVSAAHELEATVQMLSDKYEFPYWIAEDTFLRGWDLVQQEQGEAGIVQMRQGITALRAQGIEIELSFKFGMLAAAYGRVGQPAEGLSVLAEALVGEGCLSDALLYRVKGELLLNDKCGTLNNELKTSSVHRSEEAEACFLKALEVAQRQQAKSWELRAVMSLARLWKQQGKNAEARKILAEIYGWFTEGFDTKDLQEARILLEELKEGEKGSE